MMDPNIFLSLVALAAFAGSLVAGAAGWLASGDPFVARTYMSSVLRGVVSAIALAATFGLDTYFGGSTILFVALATAFLSGAGIDVLGNRASGATTVSKNTTTTTTTTSPPPTTTTTTTQE